MRPLSRFEDPRVLYGPYLEKGEEAYIFNEDGVLERVIEPPPITQWERHLVRLINGPTIEKHYD